MYNILIKKYLFYLTKIEGLSMALDQWGYFMRPMEVTFSIPCRFFYGVVANSALNADAQNGNCYLRICQVK